MLIINKILKYKIDLSIIGIIIPGIIYLLLPSVNNSLDSIGYAVDMRTGEELFRPHHLFYSSFGYVISYFFNVKNTLPFLCFINGIFSIFILCILRSIFIRFTDKKTCALILIFLGSCFGFMRFATDNEAYIIPLFFSLAASKILLTEKNVFLSSLLASIACLFHQIHFFWWLGLLIFVFDYFKENRLKKLFCFIIPALIVPLVYSIVFYFIENDCNSVIEYIFHDYFKVSYVKFELKSISFLLIFINFIRTFIQIHGYFIPLIQKHLYVIFFILISVSFFMIGLFKMKGSVSKYPETNHFVSKFAFYHLIIFVLQLLFAFISDGNAEFMVMLPVALGLYFFIKYRIKIINLFCFTIALFVWNVSLGAFPYHVMNLSPDLSIMQYIIDHSQDNKYCINSYNKARISILLKYYHPEKECNIYAVGISDSLTLHPGEYFITDLFDNELLYSRGSITQPIKKEVLSNSVVIKKDTLVYDLGEWYLTTVRINE